VGKLLFFLFIFLSISLMDTSGLFLRQRLQRLLYVDEDLPDIHTEEVFPDVGQPEIKNDVQATETKNDTQITETKNEFESLYFKEEIESSNNASPADVLAALDKIYQRKEGK
jgi:hypothetical protein